MAASCQILEQFLKLDNILITGYTTTNRYHKIECNIKFLLLNGVPQNECHFNS